MLAPIPNPQLAQAPVETLLAHFATALPWLDNAYGLVQTGVLKDKAKMPQLYEQNGTLYHRDLYPDDSLATLLFFERDGASEIVWGDALHLAGHYVHPLALVCWLNLPLIDPLRGYDFSSELALDVLTRGLLKSPDGLSGLIEPGEIEQRSERIFQRYAFPQERQQLLMWPFAGFRIPFTVKQQYRPCDAPFTRLSPPNN